MGALPDLSAAVRACGSDLFQPALRAALSDYLAAERSGVVQYSRFAVPHYLISDHVPEEEVDFYLAGAYRFDPFFRCWREHRESGVLQLIALRDVPGRVGENARDYSQRFQPKTGMADEIALLCPKIGGAVDNYFFMRDTPFRPDEVQVLSSLFPTIRALHDLNQRLLLTRLGDSQLPASGFPEFDCFVIDDANGRQGFASTNWQQIIGEDLALSEAVARARSAAPGQPERVGDVRVVSEQLGADFPPAPNGRITFVVRRPPASSSLVLSEVVEQLFQDRLTEREISICKLALRGFPSASIAEQLGIAVGTVKNHRKSIYRKLDITSERELFLLLLNSIGARD
jgi:DNA-binding CsgD family transcriptional regulator